jgi:polysaccharide export outer membrane protein
MTLPPFNITILAAVALHMSAAAAEPPHPAPATLSAATVAEAPHTLTQGDVVQVKVYREEDLTTIARITEDGSIGFPLIGHIHIAGKTDAEAARLIRDLLDARFLVNPSVTLNITGHGKRTFTVLGQVQRPGVYNMTYHDRLNILEACGMAGGYTRFANSSKIIVKRTSNGKDSVYTLNAAKMAGKDNIETFLIIPGDTITVPESRF